MSTETRPRRRLRVLPRVTGDTFPESGPHPPPRMMLSAGVLLVRRRDGSAMATGRPEGVPLTCVDVLEAVCAAFELTCEQLMDRRPWRPGRPAWVRRRNMALWAYADLCHEFDLEDCNEDIAWAAGRAPHRMMATHWRRRWQGLLRGVREGEADIEAVRAVHLHGSVLTRLRLRVLGRNAGDLGMEKEAGRGG